MRPDTVMGGVACVIAALGLLAASYMGLLVVWDPVEVGVCSIKGATIAPVPCAADGKPSTDAEAATCYGIQATVEFVPRGADGELKRHLAELLSYLPTSAATCSSAEECGEMWKAQAAQLDGGACYVDPRADSVAFGPLPEELQLRNQPSTMAYATFGFIVAIPIPFCLFMSFVLVYSGVFEVNPLQSIMARYSCDFRVEKPADHVL